MYRSEPELRRDYPEFVDETGTVPDVVRDLDGGYGLAGLPAELRTWQPRPHQRMPSELAVSVPPRRVRYLRRLLGVGGAGLLVVAVAVAGLAASSGGQPNSTNSGHHQELVPKPVLGRSSIVVLL